MFKVEYYDENRKKKNYKPKVTYLESQFENL